MVFRPYPRQFGRTTGISNFFEFSKLEDAFFRSVVLPFTKSITLYNCAQYIEGVFDDYIIRGDLTISLFVGFLNSYMPQTVFLHSNDIDYDKFLEDLEDPNVT